MNDFWAKNTNQAQRPWEQPAPQTISQPMVLDEEAVAELQEDPNLDIFEEEEEDTSQIMQDANLRLEQGRLYQMVLQGNIFADTNADPKAIRNVQREIHKFVRERMEVMLGIRQEQTAQETIVSSPFNDLEVTVLRMLASRMSKGETEKAPKAELPTPQAPPKKDGISSISGNVRPNNIQLKKEVKQVSKPQPPKKVVQQSALKKNEDDTLLTKPVVEMSPAELAAYEQNAAIRRAQNKSALPPNMVPHPSPQQLEAQYTMAASQSSIALSANRPWRQ